MSISRHGSAVPLSTSEKHGEWPTCYGYLRGRNPKQEEILRMRDQMVRFCEVNRLHLARIFHDLDVEPTQLDYPSLREVVGCAARPDTHAVILADLEFLREPSSMLAVLAETLLSSLPKLKVHCFVDGRAFAGLSLP